MRTISAWYPALGKELHSGDGLVVKVFRQDGTELLKVGVPANIWVAGVVVLEGEHIAQESL